jgi:hypothetical protein
MEQALQQRLKQGERLMLSNELHQASIGDDELMFETFRV